MKEKLLKILKEHKNRKSNISRQDMISESVAKKYAVVTQHGALATWVAPESTGRSPKNTYFVKDDYCENNIDWTSPNNQSITTDVFDDAFLDALSFLQVKDVLYEIDRVAGADSSYAFPVKVITDSPLSALFIDNMFRPIPADIKKSIYYDNGFTLLALPFNKLDSSKYTGKLNSNIIVAMDLKRRLGLVVGSAYMGSMKKMVFTVMNYYLPLEGILPLHASANEGSDKKSAVLLGLSGTGKTTLSADPTRALLGDDEHAWNDTGIANFENGIYAKMIGINPKKEPDIYAAVMHDDDYLKHGAIVENALCYPNGVFDFDDVRLTENSRASFPLTFLKNIKPSSVSGHPTAIIFLTADAYGVLPPISKLDEQEAMLWFMMGYTSKLAGTETGVTEPEATFSRFFGQPFMPAKPEIYAKMLGEKMRRHNTPVYLINTGWTGGSYGVGKRIDIDYTRKMVQAAINGDLDLAKFTYDKLFHVSVPSSCPGVPSEILFPSNTWPDKAAYDKTAARLAKIFSDSFDRIYGSQNINDAIKKVCPGK